MRPTDQEPMQSIGQKMKSAQQQIDSWKNGQWSESKKNLKLSATEIKYLFERFTSVWGSAWEKDFNINPKGVADEWAGTLAGLSRGALDKGVKTARVHEKYLDYPPKVGAFLKFCQGVDVASGPRINITQASEFANKRVQRLYPYKGKQMGYFVNDVYEHLRNRMYNTQNEHCDFARCSIEDCYHFDVFDSARLTPWLCVKHEGN